MALLSTPLFLIAGGCHSAMVNITIRNVTGRELHLIEVDYPSASFGVQSLLPGAEFHYRFKILGNGQLVMSYADADKVTHSAKGPDLLEGEEGKLLILIEQTGVQWQPALGK